jgi:CO/xanthine dehydrogenase FAD-binding subunit
LAEDSIDPIDDLRGSARYKRRVVGALVERAILRCTEAAGAA